MWANVQSKEEKQIPQAANWPPRRGALQKWFTILSLKYKPPIGRLLSKYKWHRRSFAPTFLSPWWCLPWASSDSQLEHCRRLQACWKNHHLKTPSASLRWAQGFKINLWVPWRRHHHNHQWSSKGTALLHILPSSFCKTTVFSKASQTKWLLWGYFLWICLSGHQGPWVSKAMYFWAYL